MQWLNTQMDIQKLPGSQNTHGLWVEAVYVQLEMRDRRSVDIMWAVTDDQTLAEYQLTMGLNKLHEDLGA